MENTEEVHLYTQPSLLNPFLSLMITIVTLTG